MPWLHYACGQLFLPLRDLQLLCGCCELTNVPFRVHTSLEWSLWSSLYRVRSDRHYHLGKSDGLNREVQTGHDCYSPPSGSLFGCELVGAANEGSTYLQHKLGCNGLRNDPCLPVRNGLRN